MPRPKKCRRIGFVPENTGFAPHQPSRELVEMLEEEIEALRLSDLLEMEQTAAADAMGISRGTYQRILAVARHKVAHALINGNGIRLVRSPQCEVGIQNGFRGCGRCRRGETV